MKNPEDEENLYQRMVEEIEDYAIILLDQEGYIRNWNKGAQKIKQYTESEVVGKHFSIFYLPEDLKTNLPLQLMTQARETGKASHEGWRKRKDGSKFWGSITITALHDDSGNVIGYSKVTRDLTERKLTEDTLRMSEERYHQMVAEVEDYAIILLNADGIIQNWNIGAQKIKGYTSEEAVGKKFEMFYTPEDRRDNLPYKLLKQARETGKATQQGWRVRKDGTRFWGTIVITALHNKNGDVIGFSKVTRDFTQQKEAEEKLAAYTAELEIQNSELEQFAYVASHDLQEPLRKIQTFAEVIQENMNDREFVGRYFKKLEDSARRMSDLIKSLLNYSRLSKENNNSNFVKVDLNLLLNEIKIDFELLIEEKNATIVSENLPVITGNYIQLGQLFSNLISNALKFTQQRPLIEISSEIVQASNITDAPKPLKEKQYVKIAFKDNGIGFEQEYSKLIFSLFQRLHGKQSSYAGTGIGLALCKKIAENHNGFIVANSSPGKGAVFMVYLPETEI
jgi:PAS domain S-box-containing protein